MPNNIELDKEMFSFDEGTHILNKSKNGFITWDEMMRLPHEENNYLIDKFLWEGQVIMLLAKEKVGKSLLSKQMICSLTSGEPFLDEYDVSKKCKVCYLQLEGDRGETKHRFQAMTKELNIGKENFFWRFFDYLKLDTPSGKDKLIKEIHDIGAKPDVIFIDPVYMCVSGSLSDDKIISSMIGNIRHIQETFDCTVVLVHHEHKPIKNKDGQQIDEGDSSIMGSFAFAAFVSHIIRMTRLKDGTRLIKCDTQRSGGVETEVKLTLQGDPNDKTIPLLFKKQVGKIPHGASEAIYKYIKKRKSGASAKMVIDALGMPSSTVRRSFTLLTKANQIRKNGKGDCGQVYYKICKEIK